MAQQVNAALQGIATAMAAQDARLTAVAEQQQKLLKAIADRPPIVQMAERPRSFLVDIENADGSSRKMRVSAEYQGH